MSILGDVIFGLILGLVNGLLIWLGEYRKGKFNTENTSQEGLKN